jgi:hypothetical protein
MGILYYFTAVAEAWGQFRNPEEGESLKLEDWGRNNRLKRLSACHSESDESGYQSKHFL